MTAAPAGLPPRALATLAAAIAIEGYDLSIYAVFAVAIGKAFFPADAGTSLLLAVATLGVGYVMRPLGGVFLGRYADRVGRKAAVAAVVLAMSVSTGVIALVPPYAAIGLAAPVLIVLARLVQGFASGGASAGSIAYLVESAPAGRQAFYASWQQASQVGAFLLSAIMGAVLTGWLDPQQAAAWGWRLPFLLALLFGPLGLYIKRAMPEPAAAAKPLVGRGEANGIGLGAVLVGGGITCLWNVTAFILLYFMPTYAQAYLSIPAHASFMASVAGGALLFLLCPLAGLLADRWGVRRVMAVSAIGLGLASVPLMALLVAYPRPDVLMGVQLALSVLIAGYTAPASALLARLFPARSRSTGLAIAYNLSTVLVGGFGPLIVTWLMTRTGHLLVPAWYVVAAALVSLLALGCAGRLEKRA
jgi:MHS family proline/betaine transporter-like MFS transporter